ncbi:hypA-like protein [Aspergillus sclerotiicarbonarius CBS 121057]|uniref:HypA-like protein n=1 Tax=Aspergillus sclerotiicarbonarius (strain CBS 121057 / IBT 28362) TaxID=1448318 RepID=A0A319EPK9_ASPSB|nr:hypA-like protein [Aspergillus sclerotiicarbonarius CBS 121057]
MTLTPDSYQEHHAPKPNLNTDLPGGYTVWVCFEKIIIIEETVMMATARNIRLSQADDGIVSHNVREDSARVASEVLQDDMETHHVFFNQMGFHNHIPHHVLSIYALGASPEQIRAAYDSNKSYQRPVLPVDEKVVQDMANAGTFLKCLGNEKHYSDYLAFFQKQIEGKGVEKVLQEYLFSGEEVAERMLVMLFGGIPPLSLCSKWTDISGLIHPFIHLGFGIEFNQPALVAEGLAQTAVHDEWTGPLFFWPAEKAAGGVGKPGKKSMLQILEEIRADEKLARSARWEDSGRMENGVLKRAADEMIKYAAQFTVSEEQIEEKTAEIINTVAYFASAAQRPDKQIKFDFFYLHGVTSSIFLSKIITLPFLDARTKARLLEWTGRLDLMLYVAYGTAELRLDEITNYSATKSWDTIFAYSTAQASDDGHLPKLVRALKNGEQACCPFEDRAEELGLKIKGDMWLKIANMVMDSTSGKRSLWVRGAGFDEAWKDFGGRSRL